MGKNNVVRKAFVAQISDASYRIAEESETASNEHTRDGPVISVKGLQKKETLCFY